MVTMAREKARRWEASCGERGGIEIPFGFELHVFLKLPRTSRTQSRARVDMPVFVCSRCWVGIVRRVSHTSRNQNRSFYVCSENGVTCFFLWVDTLTKTSMNKL
ncbi:uncharacterized protein [Triticum aestivum]|uniref:uncharacterized protein n=1 Tax=Triticum aestivum TaxID=4565 RepID=UPI001D00730C|nr:uncharacterized protein LOC123060167 [Triticum aestivum]